MAKKPTTGGEGNRRQENGEPPPLSEKFIREFQMGIQRARYNCEHPKAPPLRSPGLWPWPYSPPVYIHMPFEDH